MLEMREGYRKLPSDPLAVTLLAAILTLIPAAPAAAADIGSKYDRDADFSRYETFRWQLPEKPRGPRVSPGGDLDVLIRGLVAKALAAEGIAEAEDSEADLLVTYDAVATEQMDVGSSRKELTPGVAWVMDGHMRSYFEGTLVVTLIDAETEKPVWSGWSTSRLKGTKNIEKKVQQITKKVMARFPPK